ncbi:branched-chain amino acid transporter permease [Limosilactobacillus gorillae]|uniref:branched-chain amino acid transporter permease n=1 Tax=Limosilactobacillus gorillae TaxID=1450649 RepID=UPI00350E4971
MEVSLVQQLIVIGIAAVANFLTRLIPFRLFQRGDHIAPYIEELGKFLPGAIMVMLVVYCFRNVDWFAGDHGLPDLIASVVTIFVHLRWRMLFLSMAVGTVSYICLVNFIF